MAGKEKNRRFGAVAMYCVYCFDGVFFWGGGCLVWVCGEVGMISR